MTTRRLAAILAADVVGFSSMMERDEEGTLRLLKSAQRDLVEPRVREHHGRIVKTTGDGFLIEFGSPLDAVRCALEVQEALSAKGGPEGFEALRFRMGINLGDIIIEHDGDIYGDGVNVATRLEQIAEPGSVCISGKVFDEVEGKLSSAFAFTGEQAMKNLTRPVRVYSSKKARELRTDIKSLPLELCGEMGDGGVRRRRIVAVAKTARTSRRSDTPWRRLLPLSHSARSIRSMIH
jgi:adenylate cyclase